MFEGVPVLQKGMAIPCDINKSPDDLAHLINSGGLGAWGAGDIDGGKRGAVDQKAMDAVCGINEVPHDLARRVDPRGIADRAAGDIKCGEGIRGSVGGGKSTKQDTQEQHSRQQRAGHGKPSFCAWESGQYTQETWGEPIRLGRESIEESRRGAGRGSEVVLPRPSRTAAQNMQVLPARLPRSGMAFFVRGDGPRTYPPKSRAASRARVF
jgi:hypothetical protein